MKKIQAISLMEILVVLLILGSVMAFALPNMSSYYQRVRVDSSVQQLQALLYYAQRQAIMSGNSITICADDGQDHCQVQWQKQLLIKMNEVILRHVQLSTAINYTGFPDSAVVTFLPTGFTDTQNGRFTLSEGAYKKSLLISQTGRFRIEED